MSDSVEHNSVHHEDPIAGPTWLVGVIGAVLVLVTTFGVTGLYNGAKRDKEQVNFIDPDYPVVTSLRAAQAAQLDRTRYEDRAENDVPYTALVIPIERAMELTLEEMGD